MLDHWKGIDDGAGYRFNLIFCCFSLILGYHHFAVICILFMFRHSYQLIPECRSCETI